MTPQTCLKCGLLSNNCTYEWDLTASLKAGHDVPIGWICGTCYGSGSPASPLGALLEECRAYRIKCLARRKGSADAYGASVERHRRAMEAVDKLGVLTP